jgi:hypothetical protein
MERIPARSIWRLAEPVVWGTLSSSTMMVMMTAMTPSEKASRRAGLETWWAMSSVVCLGVFFALGAGYTQAGGRDALWPGRWEAFDDDAGGFEVSDPMVGAVAHEDGLAEEGDEGAGFVVEPAAVGLFEVDDEVVGDVALGAEDGGFEGAVEGGRGQFADGVGAGADGCDGEGHLSSQAITLGKGLSTADLHGASRIEA